MRDGKERLAHLLSQFDDGEKLLVAAAQMNLEGIAGVGCGWLKVKTQAWREANRERFKLFEKA